MSAQEAGDEVSVPSDDVDDAAPQAANVVLDSTPDETEAKSDEGLPDARKGPVFGVVPQEIEFPVEGNLPDETDGMAGSDHDEAVTPTPEPPTPVMDVLFEGLVTRNADELARELSTKRGEPFDSYLLREDLTRLADVFKRADARTEAVESGGIRVVFKIEEYPTIRTLTFVGAHKLDEKRAAKIVQLKAGDALEGKAVEKLRRALLEEYDRVGLADARVDVSVATVDDEGVMKADLQVIIQEGERTVVDDVVINGNKAVTGLRLRLHVKTKGSWWFYRNYYDDAAFEDDLTALRQFYTALGYFDAKVERGEFRSALRGGVQHLTPVIRISEGGRYSLGEVGTNGTRLFSEGELLEPFKELKGRRFDAKKFGAAVDAAQSLYLDKGFLSSEVRPRCEFDHETLRVNVTLEVTEKECIHVGRVRLKRPDFAADAATTPTVLRRLYDRVAPPLKDEVILRDVMLKPGEVYSKDKERETVRRLERTGLFRNESGEAAIRITNLPTATAGVHDAEIELEERSTGGIGAGGGFGDVSGIFGYLVLEERNLLGQARNLRLQTKIGTRLSDVTLSYLDRHFMGTDDHFGAAAYYNLIIREGFRERILGARAERGHTLANGWERSIRGRIERVAMREHGGYDAEEDLNDSYSVLTGRILFGRDTREPQDMPEQGRYMGAALEAGYAGGPLIKLTGESDHRLRLARNLTYRLNPSFGIMPFDADTVGLGERFFMGGPDDLRGFKPRGAGLRDRREREIAVGGAVKALARNELIFPVVDPVQGVIFLDAGTLGSSPLDLFEEPRISTGVGVRVKMRDATLSLDFGLPVLSRRDDQTQILHFAFTSRF